MALGIDDPRSGSMRVPPSSVEAEESVLGAVLLDSDAANIALEKLHSEDFYRPSHQAIFDGVLALFNKNEPIDAVTVAEELRRAEMLERVGGLGYLTQLIDAVPATSNIEHYAAIVEEHALRRRLMRVGGDIGKFATEVDQPIADVLDRAEQSVYAVSEKRVGEGLALIDPLLGPAIERAEELHRSGAEVTGLSTGLRDLDRKLTGLHPSNLIIVAARPGMGKSTLALGIAQHIAVHGDPVAIFTLEMSREEIVSRMLCAEGRIDSQRLRTGRLTEGDFSKGDIHHGTGGGSCQRRYSSQLPPCQPENTPGFPGGKNLSDQVVLLHDKFESIMPEFGTKIPVCSYLPLTQPVCIARQQGFLNRRSVIVLPHRSFHLFRKAVTKEIANIICRPLLASGPF